VKGCNLPCNKSNVSVQIADVVLKEEEKEEEEEVVKEEEEEKKQLVSPIDHGAHMENCGFGSRLLPLPCPRPSSQRHSPPPFWARALPLAQAAAGEAPPAES
jgi:hypothetical protein